MKLQDDIFITKYFNIFELLLAKYSIHMYRGGKNGDKIISGFTITDLINFTEYPIEIEINLKDDMIVEFNFISSAKIKHIEKFKLCFIFKKGPFYLSPFNRCIQFKHFNTYDFKYVYTKQYNAQFKILIICFSELIYPEFKFFETFNIVVEI